MKTNRVGVDLIKSFEDCRLIAYPDPKTGGDPWTCGWGSTGPDVVQGTVWAQEYADKRFLDDLAVFEKIANDAIKVEVTEDEFSAFVSIVFNVGPGSKYKDGIVRLKDGRPSTLLRKLNAGDKQGAADQFLLWISPGSNVERGLKRRRTAERMLFLTGHA
jgi:lysozyme